MISVAMCTYNGEKFLEEQLNSIIHQSKQPDEIVICDDGSKDQTVEKAKEILSKWPGVSKIVENDHNLGYRMNFQKAISLCQGDIIFLSDQDDVWNEKKIEFVEQVFAAHPDVDMVFHDAELVDEQLNKLAPSFWQELSFHPNGFSAHPYKRLLLGNVVQGSACAFRSDVFTHAYPFPKEAVHDEWLALVAGLFGKIMPIAQPLMKYRQGHNQIGGEVTSFQQGVKIWHAKAKELIKKHLQQIENRQIVFNTLCQRYGDYIDTMLKKDIAQYLKFLIQRKKYMLGSSFVINWKNYFIYCVDRRQAVRNILKDIFAKVS
ncbi:glycosyltransferase family 2 protein [Megasphaera elsdenii]|uniref:glycosyltransferase family 2 protein n=1 Tax=Megasphaera elsdenii TaxID=907 RepID=UPI0024329A00|nr:glycosyltransferase family 2 protein [Megasphaera elsdenii]